MQTTENLGLRKPEENDFYDVNDFNNNADALDALFEKDANGAVVAKNSKQLDGHGAEYFFPKSGGTAKDFNVDKHSTLGVPGMKFAIDSNIHGYLGVNGRNQLVFWDNALNNKEVLHTGNMANHVLPLVSNSVNTLKVLNNTVLKLNNTGTGDYTWLQFLKGDTSLGFFGYDKNKAPMVSIDGTASAIFHTGNKPTGTYTGNGSNASRQISIGGIGNIVAIYSNSTISIVSFGGFISMQGNSVVGGGTAYVDSNGVLHIANADTALNASGVTYTYQVL